MQAPDRSARMLLGCSTMAPTARFLVSAPSCGPDCLERVSRDLSACAFRVAWTINPHMRLSRADVDVERAVAQHSAFTRLLEQLGAEVERVPFVHGAYDSVFMKDSAVLLHRDARDARDARDTRDARDAREARDEALLCTPRHDERRVEQHARREALARCGFTVHPPPGSTLEGGDVVVLPQGRGAFLGTGFRSARRSADDLSRFLGAEVTPLELVDPHLFHLDMALTVLADGTIVLCEQAFSPGSLKAISERMDARENKVISIPREDARGFALNMVQVGDAVVVGAPSIELERALAPRGLRTFVSPLDEFHRAGGSAACLVARVHARVPGQGARVSVSSTAAIRSTAA